MDKIRLFLLDKGLKPNLKGFECIAKAIDLVVNNDITIFNITQILYPEIAKYMKISTQYVNRAIDYCIKSSGFEISASQLIAFYVIMYKKENINMEN